MSSRLIRTDTAGPYIVAENKHFRPIFPNDEDRALVGKNLDVKFRDSRVYGRVAEVPYEDGSIMLWVPMERKGASRAERDEQIALLQEALRRREAAMADPKEAARQDEERRKQIADLMSTITDHMGIPNPFAADHTKPEAGSRGLFD